MRPTEPEPEPALDQLELAIERTYLAYERTLMAWIRTSTGLIGLGFTLYKFFFYLREHALVRSVDQRLGPREYGLILIALGITTLAAAAVQYRHATERLRRRAPGLSRSLAWWLASLIAVAGVLAFAAAVLRV
ncbi:MAG: DUF202 domain-containing protein [Isosphaeraceae bacterium]|nr:DUF202 domain-containing protein [Isosphaeraceae bacterium]